MNDRLKGLSLPEFGGVAEKLDHQPDRPEDRQSGGNNFAQPRIYQIIRCHQAEYSH